MGRTGESNTSSWVAVVLVVSNFCFGAGAWTGTLILERKHDRELADAVERHRNDLGDIRGLWLLGDYERLGQVADQRWERFKARHPEPVYFFNDSEVD